MICQIQLTRSLFKCNKKKPQRGCIPDKNGSMGHVALFKIISKLFTHCFVAHLGKPMCENSLGLKSKLRTSSSK